MLNRLMDNARIKLPGALDGAIQLELFNVLDDMCRTVEFDMRSFDVQLSTAFQTYTIQAPSGAVPVTFYAAGHETYPSDRMRVDVGPATLVFLDPLTTQQAATPAVVTMTLAPDPDAAPTAWLTAALWAEGYSAILDGLLARMMAQAAKPYTSPQMALVHARAYRGGKSRIKRLRATRGDPSGASWAFPPFA